MRTSISKACVVLAPLVVIAALGACSTAHPDAAETTARASSASTTQIVTQHNDNARTGANLAETTLTPFVVTAATFGQRAFRALDGQPYAQPLYVGGITMNDVSRNVVYVATMNNAVYAFDADDLSTDPYRAPLWGGSRTAFSPALPPPIANPSADRFLTGTSTIGIMGTPVIDPSPAVHTMYFVAGDSSSGTAFSLIALDMINGHQIASRPIQGMSGTTIFHPEFHLQRSALLLAGGRVVIGFAGIADAGDYHGWVFSYPADTSTWGTPGGDPQVFATTTTATGAGVWQSGNGLMSDGQSIYFLTGNGTPAFSCSTGYQNSFVRLNLANLALQGNWAPSDTCPLDNQDQDLGSGGVLLMPGTTKIVGGGKTGVLFVHDVSDGGLSSIPEVFQATDRQWGAPFPTLCTDDGIPKTYDTAEQGAPNIHGAPVAWHGPTFRRIYLWGEKDYLKAYDYDANGKFNPPTCESGSKLAPSKRGTILANTGMPGGFLSVSANGSQGGTGIVWATTPEPDQIRCNGTCAPNGCSSDQIWCNANPNIVKGRLYAFDAQNLGDPIWEASLPSFAKFSAPTIADGKVFVSGFADGDPAGPGNRLNIFGLHYPYAPAWALLGGSMLAQSHPAVISWASNRMDVFARAADNSLQHKAWNGSSWSPSGSWESHGGAITADPSATHWGTTRIDVFVRDLNNSLKEIRWTSSAGWTGYTNLGGVLNSGPVAVSPSDGRIDVFVVGTDQQIKHLQCTDGVCNTWQPWDSLPTLLGPAVFGGAKPAVVASSGGRIDVFVRDANNALRHTYCTGTCRGVAWSMWENLGGVLNSDPVASSYASGTLDVFVPWTDFQLKHIAWRGGPWSAWESQPFQGMALADGSLPAVVVPAPGQARFDIYARAHYANDPDGMQLVHIAYDGVTWTWWEAMDNHTLALITSDPVAIQAGGANQILVRPSDGSLVATSRPAGVLP